MQGFPSARLHHHGVSDCPTRIADGDCWKGHDTLEGSPVTIYVRLGGSDVPVERSVFSGLLGESVVRNRVPYTKALRKSRITFDALVDLARKAEVPYTLFFAPQEVVDRQLKKKIDTLLAGLSKDAFSMNSRSPVQLCDVELIVMDILRKQEILKKLDDTLQKNTVVGCLKGSSRTVEQEAEALRSALGFTTDDVKGSKNKGAALDLLISRFESKQLLVSQSQQNFMPQLLPRGAKFSGLCVRDKKIPFLFLTGGEGNNAEPAGRKVFTLVLLGVFAARGKFTAVTYDDQTGEPITNHEYELTEEILMPAAELRRLDAATLDAVKACADTYRVTPSAFVMRARHLGMISRDGADDYLGQLADEFGQRRELMIRRPKPVNSIRKYNGAEYSRRMLRRRDDLT